MKALSVLAGPVEALLSFDGGHTTFPEVVRSAEDASLQVGITDPRRPLSIAEAHGCCTPTGRVVREGLGFAARGTAWTDVRNGSSGRSGALPVDPDGGLKSLGRPVGDSGLRLVLERWPQLRREAGERRINDGTTLGLRATSAVCQASACRSCRSSEPGPGAPVPA